jgi:hypothetical protein
MNARPMITFRKFWSVENSRSRLSYPCTATRVCIAHQVGGFPFDRGSGEGVARQSSVPWAWRVSVCRAGDRRSMLTVAI